MRRLVRQLSAFGSIVVASLLVCASVAFVAVPSVAAATTYFVAPTGSGGGSCSSPDFNSIQTAIDSASDGDVIQVCDGVYPENLDVTKQVTLSGDYGHSVIAGQGGVAVTISADNVTIVGMTITNDTGTTGAYSHDHSNLTISNNMFSDINASSSAAQGIYIKSYSVSIDNIVIASNVISGIRQVSGYNSASGIFIGDSNGLGTTITGLVIQGNSISDVKASTAAWKEGHGAYGVLINHGTSAPSGSTPGAQIVGNTITDLEGLWAHGIGLEGNTPNALVTLNQISNLVDHKTPTDAAAINVEDNPSAATISLHFNDFSGVNVGVQNNEAGSTVDASRNWWGCYFGAPGQPGCATTSGTGTVTVRPALPLPIATIRNSAGGSAQPGNGRQSPGNGFNIFEFALQ